MNKWDSLWVNGRIMTPLGIAENLALAVRGGMIDEVLDQESINDPLEDLATRVFDCKNKLITPGLIDCHTHLVYAGSRANEFEQRLKGVSYEDIARGGGGIKSTVLATRSASIDSLYQQSRPRLEQMIQKGATTVEIKSGYGLDLETEMKMLRVARKLGEDLKIKVVTTFLGAHTVPKEYQSRADDYIDNLCGRVLPQLAEQELCDFVDVFTETIGFNLKQTEKVFATAHDLNLPIKCHAEQLSCFGASKLASKWNAISCEHLEHIDRESVQTMANNDVVAVILPGAYYFLRETKKPPIELFREYGVPIAIATDCNPGSSPTTSLPLMMNMAATFFSMTIDEVWKGVTVNAAKALNIMDRGELKKGAIADFLLWAGREPVDICYGFGAELTPETVIAGEVRFSA